MPELTHSQKQIRKEQKKSRQAEQKFQETNDTSWLTKRDTHNDKVLELERNLNVNQENKIKKVSKTQKTDEQVMSEYKKLNRIEREQREKEQSERIEKENERKKKREEAIQKRDMKKKEKEEYIQERNNMVKQIEDEYEKNKKDFISSKVSELGITVSEAHKIFVKDQKVMNEYTHFKENIVEYMTSIGIDKEKAESDIEEAYKSEKEKIYDVEECFQSFRKSFIKNVEFLVFRDHSIKVMVKLGGDTDKSADEFDKEYESYLLSHSDKTAEEIYDGFSKDFTGKLEFLAFKYQTIQYLIKEKDMYPKQALEEYEKIMEQMRGGQGSEVSSVSGV